ncbi:hypothetical protein LINGRAHAP2_LOCUS4776 [Linum grandiflorum]
MRGKSESKAYLTLELQSFLVSSRHPFIY